MFLSWALDPPLPTIIHRAMSLLTSIGACVEGETLTPLGHHLAALPVHVRIGKMLLYAAILGCLEPIVSICVGYEDSIRPIQPSYPHVLSTHPIYPSYPHILSTHPIYPSYPPILSTRPIYPSYPPILSTRPIHPSYPHVLSTRPIHPSYPHVISTHPSYPHVLSTLLFRPYVVWDAGRVDILNSVM